MSGSGERRLQISQETAQHIKSSERVAQIKDQVADTAIRSPFDGIELVETMKAVDRGADASMTEASQDDQSILTPGTRGQHARDQLGLDVNAPRPAAGNIPIFDGATQIAGRGLTFEEFDRTASTDAELGKLLQGAGLPEGYTPPAFGAGRNAVKVVAAPNLVKTLDAAKVAELEQEVRRGYELDLASRSDWEKGVENAKRLMKVEMSDGSSNDGTKPRTPILQVAAQQFEARITPILVSLTGPLVKMRPQGSEDGPQAPSGQPQAAPAPGGPQMAPQPQMPPQGVQVAAGVPPELMAAMQAMGRMPGQQMPAQPLDKAARAARVSQYLSYLLRHRSSTWTTDTRKLMMKICLYGTAFRKVMFDATLGRVTSRIVDGMDVVVKADAASLEEAPRITHRFSLQANEVISKVRADVYLDILSDLGLTTGGTSPEQVTDEMLKFLECHTRYDVLGDGYPYPVIVTLHLHTGRVVRIEKNYDDEDVVMHGNKVVHITPRKCFVLYGFLPNPDGSIYNVGLGHTMGGQLKSINDLVKQLMDGAILQNSTGGFMAKGLRMGRGEQGDQMQVSANRYNYVNATGDKLRDSIVPFTFNGPSPTSFQLLDLFMSQARDLAAVINPISLEEFGANFSRMPVGTMTALMEGAIEVFSGILSGTHHSMSQEFELLYKNVGAYLDEDDYRKVTDATEASVRDFTYDDCDIAPVADPRSGTNLQKAMKAEKYASMIGNPVFNQAEVLRRYVEASGFEAPHNLIATPDERAAQISERRLQITLRMEELALMKAEAEISQIIGNTELLGAKATKALTDAEATKVNAELAPIELAERLAESKHGKHENEISSVLGKSALR